MVRFRVLVGGDYGVGEGDSGGFGGERDGDYFCFGLVVWFGRKVRRFSRDGCEV